MLKKIIQNKYISNNLSLNYYEINNKFPALIMIHAQATDALSFKNTFEELSKEYHIFSIDCPGHGKSEKNKLNYNIVSISDAILDFIKNVVGEDFYILGHSSGGLIASYVASKSSTCLGLILEDPPLFSCQGERRFKTFNYLDLSTVCHNYIEENIKEDFSVYYFKNQKMWEFFPDKSREKIKGKLIKSVIKFRAKYPNRPLKVPFFPKSALEIYRAMNEYDPYFGDAFYNDTFNSSISHSDILRLISCQTCLMKAKTNFDDKGILLAATSDEDVNLVQNLISNCNVVLFDCGHGIHIDKKKKFIETIKNIKNKQS